MRPAMFALAVFVVASLAACGADAGRSRAPKQRGQTQTGKASWYGGKFHGRKTASGERFDKNKLTAAHRRLPFGTRLKVTNLTNGRSVVVRVNDRGPFGNKRRIIDLSEAAARKLRMIQSGVVPVRIEVLRLGGKSSRKARDKRKRQRERRRRARARARKQA